MVLDGGLGYFELEGSGESGTMRVQFGNSVVTASGATVLRINLDNPPGELRSSQATRTWSAALPWRSTCMAGRA